MVGGRQPYVEDDLLWKTTFDGRKDEVNIDLFLGSGFSYSGPLGFGLITDQGIKTSFEHGLLVDYTILSEY